MNEVHGKLLFNSVFAGRGVNRISLWHIPVIPESPALLFISLEEWNQRRLSDSNTKRRLHAPDLHVRESYAACFHSGAWDLSLQCEVFSVRHLNTSVLSQVAMGNSSIAFMTLDTMKYWHTPWVICCKFLRRCHWLLCNLIIAQSKQDILFHL